MPIIFQNIWHLFLELIFAETAPKVRYEQIASVGDYCYGQNRV